MNPLRGILLKILSVMCFLAMSSMIKITSAEIPPGEAVFFRSFFAFPVIVAWLAMRGDLRDGFKTKDPLSHLWRGMMGTAAMGLGFYGLGLLPLPEVTAIGYAAPLLVVVFAAMFLNEQIGIHRLTAVAIGLIGVLVVLSPRLTALDGAVSDTEKLGALVVLGAAVCAALAQVFIRKMVLTERTSAIVFYFTISSTGASLFTIPFGWAMPDAQQFTLLVLAGVLGGVGQILLTSAYRLADASVVAPFDYSSMLLALVVGYVLFDELPTVTMLVGAAIIIAAGVMIILRERQLGLRREAQRKASTPQG